MALNGTLKVDLHSAMYLAVVDDEEIFVDSDEEKGEAGGKGAEGEGAAPKPPPEESADEQAWEFATEMKKFVFGLLDKGEAGLPWHTVLLYFCRDPEKEMRVFKAFNILGAPMYVH